MSALLYLVTIIFLNISILVVSTRMHRCIKELEDRVRDLEERR